MRFFLYFTLSLSVFSSDWKEGLFEEYPELMLSLPAVQESHLTKKFEEQVQSAGSLNSPLPSLKHLSSLTFKKGLNFKQDFPVLRYRYTADKNTEILLRTRPYKTYQVYLNGELMGQDFNSGIVFRLNQINPSPLLKKGSNELILITSLKGHHFPELAVYDKSAESIAAYKKHLSKFDSLESEEVNDWMQIQQTLGRSSHYPSQVHGIKELMKLDFKKFKRNSLKHCFNQGINPHVMAKLMGDVDKKRLAQFLDQINYLYMKQYFTILCLTGRGQEVAEFYEIYIKERQPDRSMSFANSMYDTANFLLTQGDWKSAHRIFQIFNQANMNKNKPQQRNIEFALLESQGAGASLPRFISDPEVESLKNDIDRLLKEKPERDTFSRVYKLLNKYQMDLLSSSFLKYSIKDYFLQEADEEFLKLFSEYIRERYIHRLESSILKNDVEAMESILKTTAGFARYLHAEFYLCEAFYNRGQSEKALAYAKGLINEKSYSKLAIPYVISIEKELKILKKTLIPKDLQGLKITVTGQEQSVAQLIATNNMANHTNLPDQVSIPLAKTLPHDENTSNHNHYNLKINRAPRRVISSSGKWYSSSEMETVVSNAQGQSLWHHYGSSVDKGRIMSSPQLYQGLAVGNKYFSLSYNSIQKTQNLIAFDHKGEVLWESIAHNDFNTWEPVSLPYAKQGTSVLLLIEKSRTAAPVFALAFIDLTDGKLKSVHPIAKVTDPYGEEQTYDIINSMSQYENFCEDEEAIYLFSGSGCIMKINAYEERIQWVRSYPLKKYDAHEGHAYPWTNQAHRASPWVKRIGGNLIHFDNATMCWYSLNPVNGAINWQNNLDLPTYIHSRKSDKIIFTSRDQKGRDSLVEMSATSGQVIRKKSLGTLKVQGEGFTHNQQTFLPLKNAILECTEKSLVLRSRLNFTPGRLEKTVDNRYLIYGANKAFLCKELKAQMNLNDTVKSIPVKTENADPAKFGEFTLNQVIDFPISNLYFKERTKAYNTSKPAYTLIAYESDLILLKEAFESKAKYSPAELIWHKRLAKYQLDGDLLISHTKNRAQVIDIFSQEELFSYQNLDSEIKSFRKDGDHLFVLCSDRSLKVFNLKSKSLQKTYYLEAEDFLVKNKVLISFPAAHLNEKSKVYRMSAKLEVIKELKDKLTPGYDIQSNSYATGWLTHRDFFVFDFKRLELHKRGMGYNPHRAWSMNEKYAFINFGEVLEIEKGRFSKYNTLALGNKGAVYRYQQDYIYASNTGLVTLERIQDTLTLLDDNLSAKHDPKGFCREVGEYLILSSERNLNIYNRHTGKLLLRQQHDAPATESFVLTDRSRIIMRNGKAYMHSSLNLPFQEIIFSEAKIDQIFWNKVSQSKWLGDKAPELEYRLRNNSDTLHLQMRFKGHEKYKNTLKISYNSRRYDSSLQLELDEKNGGKADFHGKVLGHRAEHSFSADGYEYFEVDIEKPETMSNSFMGELAISLEAHENKTFLGGFIFGARPAPNYSPLLKSSSRISAMMSQERYEKLYKLYTETDQLYHDGQSLLDFTHCHRTMNSKSDTYEFLNKLLVKHKASAQAHNILAVLLINELMDADPNVEFKDSEIKAAYTKCLKLAQSQGIKNFDRALSLIVINLADLNYYPNEIRFGGHGYVKFPLNFSGKQIIVPLGLFGDQIKQLDRIEIPRDRYKPALTEVKILYHGDFQLISNSEAQAGPLNKRGNKKNDRFIFSNYDSVNPKSAWFPRHGDRIEIKSLKFPEIKTDIQWKESSLINNLKLNPVDNRVAYSLLSQYLRLKNVQQADLQDVCLGILSSSPNDRSLVEGLMKRYAEASNSSLDLQLKLLSKAKVPASIRRRVALNQSNYQSWLALGPIDVNPELYKELDAVPQLKPTPEEKFSQNTFNFGDKELTYQAYDHEGKNFSGYLYLKKEFNSSSEANAYLHMMRTSSHHSFTKLKIWFNGELISDTSIKDRDHKTHTQKLALRKGKNIILIKHSFDKYSPLQVKLGNVYGGDLSYISH